MSLLAHGSRTTFSEDLSMPAISGYGPIALGRPVPKEEI